MATDRHVTEINFCLVPFWKHDPPCVIIRLDHAPLWQDALTQSRLLEFSLPLTRGSHCLEIELHNKSDLDPVQSVKITDMVLGKISSDKFVWQAIYRPRYPEPWASQQREAGVHLSPELYQVDHLGWNGIWLLQFDVPIFTWIHQVENLGWIYD